MMLQKRHWPFGEAGGGADKERENELERIRREEASGMRKQTRFDRFLVGGRGHIKKRGLS